MNGHNLTTFGTKSWDALWLFFALLACCTPAQEQQDAPRRPLTVTLADLRSEAVPEGPVAGTIAGTPFQSVSAYYTVLRRPGSERIDLFFMEGENEHCGLPGASSSLDARTVEQRSVQVS